MKIVFPTYDWSFPLPTEKEVLEEYYLLPKYEQLTGALTTDEYHIGAILNDATTRPCRVLADPTKDRCVQLMSSHVPHPMGFDHGKHISFFKPIRNDNDTWAHLHVYLNKIMHEDSFYYIRRCGEYFGVSKPLTNIEIETHVYNGKSSITTRINSIVSISDTEVEGINVCFTSSGDVVTYENSPLQVGGDSKVWVFENSGNGTTEVPKNSRMSLTELQKFMPDSVLDLTKEQALSVQDVALFLGICSNKK